MKTVSMGERNRKEIAKASAVFLAPALLVIAIFVVYPILQSFLTSTYDWNGYSASKTFIGLKNWGKLLTDTAFWAAFRNNILVMVLSIVIQMPIGLTLATFLNLVGKKGDICKVIWFIPMLMSSVAIGYLFRCALDPATGFITAISKLFGGGRIDMLGNPATVPKDMEEAAGIDGCGRYNIFWKIMLPLAKPGLATLVIYDGMNIWNEFSFALTLTQTSINRTLPLAVNEFQGQYTMNIPMIMTVLFISILPMIIVFIFFKDKLIEGMMAGAVKG